MSTIANTRRFAPHALVTLGLVLGASACSGDDDDGDDETPPTVVDEATEELDAATEEIAALTARVDDAEATLEATQSDLDTATASLEQAQADLEAETARADEVQAAFDTLGGQFPIVIDSALDGLPLAGTYDLDWAEAYCDTFATCGTLPATGQVTIAETPEGWLEMVVPDLFTVALFAVQGSLYGITDSDRILPPCGDAPQTSRVAVTLYADGVTVQQDGTRTVDRLGASVSVSGSFASGCAGGTVFYGVELTPAA